MIYTSEPQRKGREQYFPKIRGGGTVRGDTGSLGKYGNTILGTHKINPAQDTGRSIAGSIRRIRASQRPRPLELPSPSSRSAKSASRKLGGSKWAAPKLEKKAYDIGESIVGKTSRGISKGGSKLASGATALRRSIPKSIKGATKLGVLGIGAVGMLAVGVLKGALDTSKEIKYERYMENQARVKGVLNKSRTPTGLSDRSMTRDSTVGLSNALSRTRHGY